MFYETKNTAMIAKMNAKLFDSLKNLDYLTYYDIGIAKSKMYLN